MVIFEIVLLLRSLRILCAACIQHRVTIQLQIFYLNPLYLHEWNCKNCCREAIQRHRSTRQGNKTISELLEYPPSQLNSLINGKNLFVGSHCEEVINSVDGSVVDDFLTA